MRAKLFKEFAVGGRRIETRVIERIAYGTENDFRFMSVERGDGFAPGRHTLGRDGRGLADPAGR